MRALDQTRWIAQRRLGATRPIDASRQPGTRACAALGLPTYTGLRVVGGLNLLTDIVRGRHGG